MTEEDADQDKRSEDGGSAVIADDPHEAATKLMASLIGANTHGVIPDAPLSVSGMFGAAIRDWRTQNWLNEASAAAEILRARGVAPESVKRLGIGDVHRIFENGSKVDDPKLCSFWAALLANSADPGKAVSPRPILVETLNRLGPLEANLLEVMWSMPGLESDAREEIKQAAERNGTQTQFVHAIQHRLHEQMEERFRRVTKEYSAAQLKIAISLLIGDDLISPNVQTQQFHAGSPPLPSVIGRRQPQMVDPTAVANALNALVKRSDLLLGKSEAKLPAVQSNGVLYYHLTPFGRELMDACH